MPRPPVWFTNTRTPKCRNNHAYISFRENQGKMILETRGDCIHFMTCGTCKSHAFGVQSAAHETIAWYDADRAQFDAMLAMPATTKTWVFLEYLGYMNESEESKDNAA